ncbi:DUF3298 and DUF4163 domain-containing protein [Tsuneonella sp. YG55]|uniref:DUF3298 and DUF4163 domain-containing protein n=1 Tax=Tsuneonella litorea TaxID=2976475 RepID=A0A9X2W4Y7_9SPHN|nr:DUF3298 and DUF4163 domain-containing protein [Tsuneonella litorea]MCT2560140.1 DUF3298 and DUF4163 domain-containing protein [Tsuneonella litorea]
MPIRPLLPALLMLAACSSPEEMAGRTGVERTAEAKASVAASPGDAKRAAYAESENNDLFSYAFSYPAQVGAHPELAKRLKAAADKAKADLIAEARAGQADAKASGYPFNPHSWREDWKVVADLPGYLSLSGAFSTFSGGAHGMYGLESLVWDKQAKNAIDGIDLFRSPGTLEAAMRGDLCRALDAERTERRGTDLGGGGGMFDDCPGLDEATILVGSSNGQTFDRITVWYGPYVAGPYAEGAYELDFPMTSEMLGAVKPAFASAFSAKR